jgi:hypothetical protein
MEQFSHIDRQAIDRAAKIVYPNCGILDDDDRNQLIEDDDKVLDLAIKYGLTLK